ncbi:MAG TPA: hypothetical protein VGM06_00545 [Polyangiaceae bacterium]
MPGIDRIRRLARRAERRIRLGRALRVASKALCVALVVVTVDVALRKLGVVSPRAWRVVLSGSVGGVVVAGVWAWWRRLPERAGARALDRFHDLHDRLASALAFADLPAGERTPFMAAAIDDAVRLATSARPRAAVPIRMPPELGVAAGLGALLAGVAMFRVRAHVAPVHVKTIDPIDMASDDLDDVHDFLTQIDQSSRSDETKAAIEEFNRLVDDIANKRLDRTEAFRRMEALEDKLLTGSQADKKALEAQLDRIAEELKKSDLTRPAGDALADHKLEQARAAMQQLAKQVRGANEKPVDKAKLDEMRESLKKAAGDADKQRAELEARRQELADEILKMKEKVGDGGSDEERSLLAKKERELERLDRDLDAKHEAGRQLDRLDRDLDQAAQDLMKDLGLSADDLDQGAEDINHMQEQEMTQQQKEELRQKLQELRELVRQQGQGGKSQVMRLKRFGRMARGQSGSGGQSGQGDPQQGQGDPQSGQGQGDQDPNGGGSQGAGAGGETWVIGPNGEKMLMLSKGQGSGGSSEGNQPGGNGAQGSGKKWGEGHDPNVQGAATSAKMGTEDTQVQGADTGQGGSRSQVILGAAERGFSSHGYKRVYGEYHQVAEESLSKEEVPSGYRFYVKRYFQLIRPREEK